jgi:hypothetical protein
MRYDEYYAASPGWPSAPHHKRIRLHYLERQGLYWDFLTLCSVMRDRCFPSVIRGLTGRPVQPAAAAGETKEPASPA